MNGLWIVWLGQGGELDRRFVPPGRSVAVALRDMVLDGEVVDEGDRFEIIAGDAQGPRMQWP